MSNYNAQFSYKGHSNTEYDLIVTSFNPDHGEVDAFLGMESLCDKRYDGTLRYEYGGRYSGVVIISITMIKKDYTDFTIQEYRNVARWLTGAKMSSWLDCYQDMYSNDIAYSFLCKCTSLQQQKMDGRIIGVIAQFESLAPWAFSPLQGIKVKDGANDTITGTADSPFEFTIRNNSDDIYSFLSPSVAITNLGGANATISLQNTSLPQGTPATQTTSTLNQLVANEQITLYNNQMALTDAPSGSIGNRFNWAWPKLVAGDNKFQFVGTGKIAIAYRYPIKIGDGMMGYDYSSSSTAIRNCETIGRTELNNIFGGNFDVVVK